MIKSKEPDPATLKMLALKLETTYATLNKDFGFEPELPLLVILYEREEFEDYTRQPHWVRGLYDGKIRLPAYNLGHVEAMLPALAMHEMTHAFVTDISRQKAPPWIQEGLAVYMETQVQPRDWTILRLAVKTKTLLSLDELMNEQKPTHQNDALYASLFYLESCSLTGYLIQHYGMFKIKKLLEAFGAGKDYDEAIRSVLEIDPAQLEEQWKDSVIRQFPPQPASPAAATA